MVSVTEQIIGDAEGLARKHGLRAYDAVQLAAALDTSRIVSQVETIELTMVSADVELNAAAIADGLNVEDPKTTESHHDEYRARS